MDLTLDEQRLIAEYRRLTATGRDDLLAYAAALLRQAGTETNGENDTATNQCRLKSAEPHPEAEKTPFFTE
ncbi:hypothetical protein FO488_01370 [Geobacter sp. FeAm09]|uniref:hypothetical protein n=1 Tax=Geobacter sp. FeAm09 TaxID=2597769 RepID=UPI0011EE3661|nr:hypothetical protein [Geobacter sp. FeAm09]QEM66939.1 hypothetical protein FO488_01370 [Geobacter sp. FeAm09]